MGRSKKWSGVVEQLAPLFPYGTVHFVIAVMCMTLALAMLTSGLQALILGGASGDTQIVANLGALLLTTLLIVHPSFMVTRGKAWARPFLKRLNVVTILGLAFLTIWELGASSDAIYASLFGLTLALIALSVYRSQGFESLCVRFERTWAAHRERRASLARSVEQKRNW